MQNQCRQPGINVNVGCRIRNIACSYLPIAAGELVYPLVFTYRWYVCCVLCVTCAIVCITWWWRPGHTKNVDILIQCVCVVFLFDGIHRQRSKATGSTYKMCLSRILLLSCFLGKYILLFIRLYVITSNIWRSQHSWPKMFEFLFARYSYIHILYILSSSYRTHKTIATMLSDVLIS